MSTPEIRMLENRQELAAEAADLFVWLAQQAVASGARFHVALSGGSTPQALYEALAAPQNAAQVRWPTVRFYFGDERCIPPDHQESNYRLAQDHLFRVLKIAPEQVRRMEGERPPREAAERYEAALREDFGSPAPQCPRLDLILLGLGEDGHTASLFPGTPALRETSRLVTTGRSPKGIADRLTFTVPLINEAAVVVFLVAGSDKAAAVRAVLEPGQVRAKPLPAGLIAPHRGRLIWFLDRAAASDLDLATRQLTSHEE